MKRDPKWEGDLDNISDCCDSDSEDEAVTENVASKFKGIGQEARSSIQQRMSLLPPGSAAAKQAALMLKQVEEEYEIQDIPQMDRVRLLTQAFIWMTNSTGDRGERNARLKPHHFQFCRLLQEEAERASEDAAFLLMGIYESPDVRFFFSSLFKFPMVDFLKNVFDNIFCLYTKTGCVEGDG